LLQIGDKAPNIVLKNQDGIEVSLVDYSGKWIIVYFYPKDNTPGCTNEACDFTQAEPQFDDLDAVILGVSPDSPKKHRNFIEKKELTITLLADEEKTLCESYGVWQEKMNYGRKYMGVVRSTFIISPEGKISAAWENVKVRRKKKIAGEQITLLHVDEVKEELERLQAN